MDNLKINETIREGVLYPNGGVNKGDLVAPLKGILENEASIDTLEGQRGVKFPSGGNVSATLTALQDPSGNTLPIKISSSGVFATPVAFTATAVGGGDSHNVDLALGNICTIQTVTGKTNNINISRPTNGVYIFIVKQPASGAAATVTDWNAGTDIVWSGGTAPTLTTTNSYVDIITLIYDGTTMRGTSTLNFAS